MLCNMTVVFKKKYLQRTDVMQHEDEGQSTTSAAELLKIMNCNGLAVFDVPRSSHRESLDRLQLPP